MQQNTNKTVRKTINLTETMFERLQAYGQNHDCCGFSEIIRLVVRETIGPNNNNRAEGSKQGKSRRKHYSTDILPTELHTAIKRMLINNEWPDDFKGPRNGTPRYSSVVEYCKQKGFVVSESSVGRFALREQIEP